MCFSGCSECAFRPPSQPKSLCSRHFSSARFNALLPDPGGGGTVLLALTVLLTSSPGFRPGSSAARWRSFKASQNQHVITPEFIVLDKLISPLHPPSQLTSSTFTHLQMLDVWRHSDSSLHIELIIETCPFYLNFPASNLSASISGVLVSG